MTVYYSMAAFFCLGSVFWTDHEGLSQNHKKKAQEIFLILSAAVFIIVATCRYGVGFDYFNYKNLYEELGPLTVQEIFQNPVAKKFIGYSLFMRLCELCGLGYHGMLFIINLLLTAVTFWFITKYSPLPWLSVYLYLVLQFFAHSMNLLRQSIAAAICLLAYPFIKKRKIFPFIGLVLLAASFHLSALAFLPFYWVLNWKVSGKKFLLLSALIFPVYLFSNEAAQFITQYIFRSYAGYIGSRYWKPLGMRYIVFPAIYFGAVWLGRKRLLREDKDNHIFINSAFYTLVLYVFSTHHMLLERFSIFLFPYAMAVLPRLAATFLPDSRCNREGMKPSKDDFQFRELLPDAWAKKLWLPGKNPRTDKKLTTLVLVLMVVAGFGYLIFASVQGKHGFHKMYPYVSLFHH